MIFTIGENYCPYLSGAKNTFFQFIKSSLSRDSRHITTVVYYSIMECSIIEHGLKINKIPDISTN
jgi:hypothetical protein